MSAFPLLLLALIFYNLLALGGGMVGGADIGARTFVRARGGSAGVSGIDSQPEIRGNVEITSAIGFVAQGPALREGRLEFCRRLSWPA